MIESKVVMGSLYEDAGAVEGIGALCRFRWQFYSCLRGRADAVFELIDALLCSDGPVRSLVDLGWLRSIGAGTAPSTTGSTVG